MKQVTSFKALDDGLYETREEAAKANLRFRLEKFEPPIFSAKSLDIMEDKADVLHAIFQAYKEDRDKNDPMTLAEKVIGKA